MASPAFTVAGLKTWAKANKSLAETVALATAYAQTERARVDAYEAPIFARYGFTDADDGTPITDPRRLYLSGDDAACAAFYAECLVAHKAHGWTGDPEHCPALVADSDRIKVENLLLESLGEFMGSGKEHGFWTLELRKKALDLALGVCLLGASAKTILAGIAGPVIP